LSALDEVNRLQQEASQSVEKLATGESDNVAEVLSSVRKADVAFSLLMEMRNKLVDAYRELQQMRV
jgi:flagellar hook-basal body complex protein FliE